jgi:mxaL protein
MRVRQLVRNALDRDSLPILAALILLVIALSLPAVRLPRLTYTYLVFLDITQSMNVQDYELDGVSVSRLLYARQAVKRALRDLPCGSRVGLGAFAEYRTLLLVAPIEVCGNYADLLTSLDYIDGRMRWRDASEITKGVFWSIRAAKELGDQPNVMFMTDGQEAPPLRPGARPSFEDVKHGEIHGWLIGVGGYSARPIPRTDREGNVLGYWRAEDVIQRNVDPTLGDKPSQEQLSSLREPHLQELAQRVGFEYARLARIASVSEAMRDARFAQSRPVPTDLSWLPAIGALLVLVWRFCPAAPSALRRSATITPRWKLIARRLVVRPRARF